MEKEHIVLMTEFTSRIRVHAVVYWVNVGITMGDA